MGDPGGIGPEIILKTLKSPGLLRGHAWVVAGIPQAFQRPPSSWSLIRAIRRKELAPGKIYFLDVSERARELGGAKAGSLKISVGKAARPNAAAALAALEEAASAACGGEADAIVTAPVNKTAMRLLDERFCGHTEYLAKRAGVKKFAMMFVGARLCLTLVTVHVALKEVSPRLTRAGIYDKILLTDCFLKRQMAKKKPSIAVCALNPHGEETGSEERQIILPAVLRARKSGVRVSGPFSADQLFYEAYQGRYDALVCMYHDQALGPFKMISFHDGVNVTAGLPFVRTSPDHGTAFDIAAKGLADPSSMTAAAKLAARLIAR